MSDRRKTRSEIGVEKVDLNLEPKDSESNRKWTREQILTALSMSLMNFTTQISFAVIAPFFPVEAEKKGATGTEIGFIFGVFQLVIFVTSPIYGKFINRIGAKFMFISGSLLCGLCNIAFGFLDEVHNTTLYVSLCLLCRILEANGASMLSTASFAIMAKQFHNNVGSALGVLKAFSGVGMAIGPSIGGGLYSIGGFKAPFISVGGVVVVAAVVSQFVLPKIEDITLHSGSFLPLLKSPGCFILYFVIIGSSMALSAMDPIFSPFLAERFQMTVGQVGLIFLIAPGIFAIVAPFCGWVSDKGWHGVLVIVGAILNGTSFLILGPCPLLQALIPLAITGVVISLVLMGLTVGFIIVPIFPLVIKLARSLGYEESLQTYGLISGYFNSASALGAFVGPAVSGYLNELYGFAWSTSSFGFIIIALGMTVFAYIMVMKFMNKWPLQLPATVTTNTSQKDEEETPILAADELKIGSVYSVSSTKKLSLQSD